jgi:uncharacterized surface protein with fasciclin (FAS1) repeats
MRIGQFTWLAVVPLSLSLTGLFTIQPGQAKTSHHKHAKAAGGGGNSIVTVADKNGCSLFDAKLKEGRLFALLQGSGPFTVFVPNDLAFQHLPKDEVQSWPKRNLTLTKVLKYHVVKGNYSTSDLGTRRSIPTMEGDDVMLNSKDGKLIVDGALVTKPDIKCSNGVIHVIDTVLLPERGK